MEPKSKNLFDAFEKQITPVDTFQLNENGISFRVQVPINSADVFAKPNENDFEFFIAQLRYLLLPNDLISISSNNFSTEEPVKWFANTAILVEKNQLQIQSKLQFMQKANKQALVHPAISSTAVPKETLHSMDNFIQDFLTEVGIFLSEQASAEFKESRDLDGNSRNSSKNNSPSSYKSPLSGNSNLLKINDSYPDYIKAKQALELHSLDSIKEQAPSPQKTSEQIENNVLCEELHLSEDGISFRIKIPKNRLNRFMKANENNIQFSIAQLHYVFHPKDLISISSNNLNSDAPDKWFSNTTILVDKNQFELETDIEIIQQENRKYLNSSARFSKVMPKEVMGNIEYFIRDFLTEMNTFLSQQVKAESKQVQPLEENARNESSSSKKNHKAAEKYIVEKEPLNQVSAKNRIKSFFSAGKKKNEKNEKNPPSFPPASS